jgi:hypothetical protein
MGAFLFSKVDGEPSSYRLPVAGYRYLTERVRVVAGLSEILTGRQEGKVAGKQDGRIAG